MTMNDNKSKEALHENEDIVSEEENTDNVVELSEEEDSIDETAALIESLQAENAELKDKFLRAVADVENTRRRAQRDKEEAGKYAISSFARELLVVADNMTRAIEHAPENLEGEPEHVQNLMAGIKATQGELMKTLAKMGIRPVETEGLFNPNHHEVMFEVPGTGQPAGTIIQVMEPGYMIHDRLLRPARVGVAAKENGGAPEQAVDVEA